VSGFFGEGGDGRHGDRKPESRFSVQDLRLQHRTSSFGLMRLQWLQIELFRFRVVSRVEETWECFQTHKSGYLPVNKETYISQRI